MDRREQLMLKLMETDFAAFELALYLDTHPDDKRMYPFFTQYVNESEALKSQYEDLYGPLTLSDGLQDNKWAWVDNPWPWD